MSGEYERAFLGALIQEPALMDSLRPDGFLFEDSRNAAVFSVVRGLAEAGKPVDLLTIAETVNGSIPMAYVAGLTDVPTVANARFYAGELRKDAKARGLRRLGSELVEGTGDVEERILHAQAALLRLQAQGAEAETVRPREVLHDIVSDASDRMARQETGLTGVPSGIPRLDLMTGGFQAGDLVLIGARTSVGKSALALTFAEHQAAHGLAVAFVTLEMSARQLLERLLAMRSHITTGRLRLGFLNSGDFDVLESAAGEIAELDLRLLDRPGADLATIGAWIRSEVAGGARIAFVDYAGLIGGGDSRVPQWERMSEISHGLKAIARQNRVPVVALVQLGLRPVELVP
jgi:replicative DNA helicase